MWSFVEVVRIEQHWGKWCALVTLVKAGVPESFYLKFDAEPTPAQAQAAGIDLALRKTLDEAPVAAGRSITQDEFVKRFTLAEIGGIYAAAPGNASLLAFVKRLEFSPSVDLDSDDVVNGLALLEQVGLIGAGRAAQIRGAA